MKVRRKWKGWHTVGHGDQEEGVFIQIELCSGWTLTLEGTSLHESVDMDKIPYDKLSKAILKIKEVEDKL